MDICGEYFCSRCMLRLETDDSGICPHCGYDHAHPARSTDQLEEGTILADRYQLGAVIGRGGFGITYAAWDETLHLPVAVKEFFPRDFASRDVRTSYDVVTGEKYHTEYSLGLRRFIEESRVLAMFQNVPGIVNVSDCFEENDTFYIVMEYVHGVTLDVWVSDHKPDAKTLLSMFRGPIDALDAVHRQGVQHRDIKPSNMLVEESGVIKLIDFGSARLQTHQGKSIVLTEKYAPVEQYDLKQQQGPWTDVYSLCATMYEMLTGADLQTSISRQHHDELAAPSSLGVRLKPYQQRALMAGLSVEPDKRIRSMDALRSLLYNLPLPEELLRRKALQRRMAVAAAGVVLAATGVLFNFIHGFALTESARYALYPDGFHLMASDHASGTLNIPASFAFIPVSAVHADGLRGSDITELTIPGSVSVIEPRAFSNCMNLQVVRIEDGVTSVGASAFANCPALHTVLLPDSVTDIAPNAFDGTSPLLTLWGSHRSHAEQFAGEQNLRFVSESDFDYTISNADHYRSAPPVTFDMAEASQSNHAMAVLSWAAEQPVEGVRITGYRGSAADVVIPSYIDGVPVTHISFDKGSSGLPDHMTSIVLPEHLITLPTGLLTGKTALTSITLGGGLRVIEDYAFSGTKPAVINLPGGIQSIGRYAFENVPIARITLPDTLTSVGDYAFAGSLVETVTIPDSVRSFGKHVFFNCTHLKSASVPSDMAVLPDGTFRQCISLTDVQLPDALARIGVKCFSGCRSLETLILPNSVEKIDLYAFESCLRLRILAIPSGTKQAMHASCIDGCPSYLVIYDAEEWNAPQTAAVNNGATGDAIAGLDLAAGSGSADSQTKNQKGSAQDTQPSASSKSGGDSIGGMLRTSDSAAPRKVTTGLRQTEIAAAAYANDATLAEINIPSAETIGDLAFFSCTMLNTVRLPDNLQAIGLCAFEQCTGLVSVSLPESLEYLGDYAFNASGLERVTLSPALTVLPDGCLAQTRLTQVTVPDSVTLCGAAFYNCTSLTTVQLGEGVRTLRSTFYGCVSLREITLPASLGYMTRSTFKGCTALEHVWIMNPALEVAQTYDTTFYTGRIYREDGTTELPAGVVLEGPSDGIVHVFEDCPDVTVHGYRGSAMEQYCAEHGVRFEPIN